MEIAWFIIGALVGAVLVALLLRAREQSAQSDAAGLAERLSSSTNEQKRLAEKLSASDRNLTETRVTLEHERRSAQERAEIFEQARAELSDRFKTLSNDALERNNRAFLELARSTLERFQIGARDDLDTRRVAVADMLKPIKESLEKVDGQMQRVEVSRRQAYGALTEQVRLLAETQDRLRSETGSLVTALRAPSVRGRWGEMQLRRVVETAGMLEHCDFEEQVSSERDGNQLRPDLVVKLPGGKQVVVDAKAPLAAYLDAVETDDPDEQSAQMARHARQVGDHVTKLSAKAYWEQFETAPDFVIMFLPGEPMFSEALRQNPNLIEEAARQRVFIATPVTLISLLRAVAYGWQQETVAESAREVSRLGRELHDRLGTLADHFGKLGRSLDGAVQHYNGAVGSLERRVLVTARRFSEYGASGDKDIESLSQIDRAAQKLQAPEFALADVDEDMLDAGGSYEIEIPLELDPSTEAVPTGEPVGTNGSDNRDAA
jgi:DNA recombination protein RmuC